MTRGDYTYHNVCAAGHVYNGYGIFISFTNMNNITNNPHICYVEYMAQSPILMNRFCQYDYECFISP